MNRPCTKCVASPLIAGSADVKAPLTRVAFNTMRHSTSQLRTFLPLYSTVNTLPIPNPTIAASRLGPTINPV